MVRPMPSTGALKGEGAHHNHKGREIGSVKLTRFQVPALHGANVPQTSCRPRSLKLYKWQ